MKNRVMLDAALAALRRPGAVLLVPTETVYGLVCDWQDTAARARIYALKARDSGKPLAMFARNAAMAEQFGVQLNAEARTLLARFAPGPITVIAPAEGVYPTVGVRIPAYEFILDLLDAWQRPLASTSANASGMPNVLSVSEALAELHGEVDLAVDGGTLPPDAAASTVVNACVSPVRILRSGPIEEAAIRAALV